MAATRRASFALVALAAGAVLYLLLSSTAARAGALDDPMQPIARDAVAPMPPKRNVPLPGDPELEPIAIRSADRMAPEYPGDPGMAGPDDPIEALVEPMDALVDRTVDAVGSVSATTTSILRLERR